MPDEGHEESAVKYTVVDNHNADSDEARMIFNAFIGAADRSPEACASNRFPQGHGGS
jgi:hypothetical protein